MSKYLTSHEALKVMDNHYVDASLKDLISWIKEGKLRGERTEDRFIGYKVLEDDLLDFIETKRPGIIQYVELQKKVQKKELVQKNEFKDAFPESFQQLSEMEKRIIDLRKEIQDLVKNQQAILQQMNRLLTELVNKGM